MEAQRFDTFARLMVRPAARRRLLFGLAAGPFLGLIAARLADDTEAKKKRKRKKRKDKKPQPNEFGCLEVGQSCKNADQCCSGICEGKKCRAHHTGTCIQDSPGACTAENPAALKCNNAGGCLCFGTTAGSLACVYAVAEICAECTRDPDCEALGFPPGSVCVPFSVGACAGMCESGMACLLPCPDELDEPGSE